MFLFFDFEWQPYHLDFSDETFSKSFKIREKNFKWKKWKFIALLLRRFALLRKNFAFLLSVFLYNWLEAQVNTGQYRSIMDFQMI